MSDSSNIDPLLPDEMAGIREPQWAAAAVKSLFVQEDIETLAALVMAGESKFVSDGRRCYERQGFSDQTLREMFANVKVQVDYILLGQQEQTEIAHQENPKRNRVITTTPDGVIEERD